MFRRGPSPLILWTLCVGYPPAFLRASLFRSPESIRRRAANKDAQNEWGLNSKAAPKIILGSPLQIIADCDIHIAYRDGVMAERQAVAGKTGKTVLLTTAVHR
jgi:hypothetical protein